jgi:hypothetical protein
VPIARNILDRIAETVRVAGRVLAVDLLGQRQLRDEVYEILDNRAHRPPLRLRHVVADDLRPGLEPEEQPGEPRRLALRAPEAPAQSR